jgi:hypothetical protein
MCDNIFAEYGSILLVFFLEFGFKLFGIVPAFCKSSPTINSSHFN